MSLLASVRRTPNASIPQVVVGTLVTLFALLSAQMAGLTAYVDTFGKPGGITRDGYDTLGRPVTQWAELWQEFGPLLWGVYAFGLLFAAAYMWRLILTRPPRLGWTMAPVLLVASFAFWALELERFYS